MINIPKGRPPFIWINQWWFFLKNNKLIKTLQTKYSFGGTACHPQYKSELYVGTTMAISLKYSLNETHQDKILSCFKQFKTFSCGTFKESFFGVNIKLLGQFTKVGLFCRCTNNLQMIDSRPEHYNSKRF